MKLLHNLRIGIISSVLLLTHTGTLLAETTVLDHQHGHNENVASGLSLDHGEKWKTDVPLRQGMQSINDAVMHAVPAYHNEMMTKSASEKLAKQINTQVNYMIKNCKLEPAADATLHVLIGDLLTAANKVSKDPLSEQGMPRLVNTLQQYQDYFDHPQLNSIH